MPACPHGISNGCGCAPCELEEVSRERDELKNVAAALQERAEEAERRLAEVPPPVCTGSGTIMADFRPMVSSMPSMGRCGICQRNVPLMVDAQTIAPHSYRPEDAPMSAARRQLPVED